MFLPLLLLLPLSSPKLQALQRFHPPFKTRNDISFIYGISFITQTFPYKKQRQRIN
ncbi:hypothetical protein AHAS_Ahas03G0177400 [Arachis hypogaea]